MINREEENENKPIIQSLWIGNKLSTMEILCLSSFVENGHTFHLYTYEDIKNIPDGIVVMDANEILPSNMIFKYRDHNSYAGFSNLFRYKLLYDKGGYWVDTDVICLNTFSNEAEYVFASERLIEPSNKGKTTKIASCVLKSPPGSEIMEYCYKVSLGKDSRKIKWGETGPLLVTDAVEKFGLESYIAVPNEYCPVNWWEWDQLIDGSADNDMPINAKAIHLWNEMWRRNDADKDFKYDQNSIYGQLKNVYLRPKKSRARLAITAFHSQAVQKMEDASKKFYKELYRHHLLPFSINTYRDLLGMKNRKEEERKFEDAKYIKKLFKEKLGYNLDLSNPKTLNEKIQWLKINDRTDLHTLCADKYKVRKLIERVIGKEYLVPLLYHTSDPDKIRPENLPEAPFVIKTSHDSGSATIVWQKESFDWEGLRKKLISRMKHNYYYPWREWQYKNIKPRILVEKLLLDNNGYIPYDYKLHCFNGKLVFTTVSIDRFNDLGLNLYDAEWNLMKCEWLYKNGKDIKKPKNFEKIQELAEKLASPFDYARIDFYTIGSQIFFSEITFHPNAGFEKFNPPECDRELGDMLILPIAKKKHTKSSN